MGRPPEAPEAPELPCLDMGSHVVCVDRITGIGRSLATVSVRQQVDGQPLDRAVATTSTLDRDAITHFAMSLLDLADQMVHDRAYDSSSVLAQRERLVMQRRAADSTKRYFKLIDRLPLLQLAQRVLERCTDDTAKTLTLLLCDAEATGTLPVRAKVGVETSASAPTPPRPQGSTSH